MSEAKGPTSQEMPPGSPAEPAPRVSAPNKDALFLAATVACVLLAGTMVWRGSGPGQEGSVDPNSLAPGGRKFREPFTRPTVAPIAREEVLAKALSLDRALHWKRAEGLEVQCELCPILCRLRDGERGQCRVRVNYSGTLYTLVYGRLVAEHVDPIEKKPLNHFLPATGVFSIATAGCNFGCTFCQNWQISQAFPEEVPFATRSPEATVAMAIESRCPSIAYTYTEPSVFFEYMIDCARLARSKGLANVWVTCGYLSEKPLRELARYLDAANVDVKAFDDLFYSKTCGGQLAPVLRTIEVLKELKVHLEITNLIVPEGNDDPEMIRKLCRWVSTRIGPQTPIHFTRYHPAFRMERPGPTPLMTLERARAIAHEEGLRYVYVGNTEDPSGMSTHCGSCGRLLVERRVFHVLSNVVKDGCCPSCEARIPGLWARSDGGGRVKVPVDEPPPPLRKR